MHAFLLQDWLTIRGDNNDTPKVATITQSESCWLDLSAYEDLLFYLDVRELPSGVTVQMIYQTAPTKEDAAFQALVPAFNVAIASTPRVDRAFASSAMTPVAKYVRWQLHCTTATVVWDVTFRVWVAALGPSA